MPLNGDGNAKEVFLQAIEIESAKDREAFLVGACAKDGALRDRVNALIRAHEGPETLLDGNAVKINTLSKLEPPNREALQSEIGPYTLVGKLGEGGMGVVYLAQQESPFRRQVALKVIKPEMDSRSVLSRFESERQTLAIMDHPFIAKAFDAGTTENGLPFFVMELVQGTPVTTYCDDNRLTVSERLQLFVAVCDAIQHAHQKGVIHRDIKPSNVLVSDNDGKPFPKVIDFGVAKALTQHNVDKTMITGCWMIVGTPQYMSPEQADPENSDIDTRSDIYSLGVLLYELLTGNAPYGRNRGEGQNPIGHLRKLREVEIDRPSSTIVDGEEMRSISESRGTSIRGLRNTLRGDLDVIILHALEKNREHRYQSVGALSEDVQRHLRDQHILAKAPSIFSISRKFAARNRMPLAIAICVLIGILGWTTNARLAHRHETTRRMHEFDIPDIKRTIDVGNMLSAFLRFKDVREALGDAPVLQELKDRICTTANITSSPVAAEVSIRDWHAPSGWVSLGLTPLRSVELPRGYLRYRFTLAGHDEVERLVDVSQSGDLFVKIESQSDGNSAMVRVSKGEGPQWLSLFRAERSKMIPVDYLIDRFEVTNLQYKRFLNSARYDSESLWVELKTEYPESWKTQFESFVDSTNIPGPAHWINGNFVTGTEYHPVTGVSWYEAAAYARYCEKQLPTIHHWGHAADFWNASRIVADSNFSGQGTAPVGSNDGIGFFGIYDLAGNVKEWCINRGKGEMRFALGGSFQDPEYMFSDPHLETALSRTQTIGFRCVRYFSPPPDDAVAEVSSFLPDFDREPAYGASEFATLTSIYGYARSSADDYDEIQSSAGEDFRHITIATNTAYDDEKLLVHLFLPATSADKKMPVVVFFPGRGANNADQFDVTRFIQGYPSEFIKRGWAVAWPTYKGTFERRGDIDVLDYRWNRKYDYKDLVVCWVKDVARTIDYLETRDDLDLTSLTYLGGSLGACLGPIMLAVEQRFQAGVLAGGGLYMETGILPEVDTYNYAPHVTTPVLMFNGRYDVVFPLESSQEPLFRVLGTRQRDKEHIRMDCGHVLTDKPSVVLAADKWLRARL